MRTINERIADTRIIRCVNECQPQRVMQHIVYAMEYSAGKDLRNIKDSLQPETIEYLLHQVFEVVLELQAHNLYHSDLWCGNILVNCEHEQCNIKLIDFNQHPWYTNTRMNAIWWARQYSWDEWSRFNIYPETDIDHAHYNSEFSLDFFSPLKNLYSTLPSLEKFNELKNGLFEYTNAIDQDLRNALH